MSGKKGRSGRRKSPTTAMKQALDELRGDIPELISHLKAIATLTNEAKCPHCGHTFRVPGAGDREALKYLIDRVMGKAAQSIEIDNSEAIGSAFAKAIFTEARKQRALQEPRIKVITEGGDNAIHGENTRILEGEEAATEDVQEG